MLSVDDVLRLGRDRWPELCAESAALRGFVEERLSAELSETRAADLFLAAACASGAPGALEAFDLAQLGKVGTFLSHMRPDDAFVEDVRQILRLKLFLGERPRIAEYRGAGELTNWLRVMAVRAALDVRRKKTERLEGGDDSRRGPAGADPELEYIKERYRGEFKRAFESAIASLDAEQRHLLRLHFVDGLTLDEMAGLFHVHRATIARRIASARDSIVAGTGQLVRERLAIDDSEFQSMVGLLRSRLDLSIAGCLGS